jgi:hypothetical protein
MLSMDKVVRLLVIAALLGWSVFRIVRYFRHGMAKSVTAVPPSAGLLPNAAPTAGLNTSTTSASTGPARLIAGLTVVIVWLAANAALWITLLKLPMLASVPLIWRLFVGVFANFYLFPFARGLGERLRGDPQATQ